MSRLAKHLKMSIACVGGCQMLIQEVAAAQISVNRPLIELYANWIADALGKAKSDLGAIDPDKVQALRKAKQQTRAVLEIYLNAATLEMVKETSGVLACVDHIFQKSTQGLTKESIEKLGQLNTLVKRTIKLCNLMAHPVQDFLLSPAFTMIILLVGVLLAIAFAVAHLSEHSLPGNGSAQSLSTHVAVGLEKVQKAASQPDESFLDKLENGIKALTELFGKIPGLVGALTALLAAVQGLASGSAGKPAAIEERKKAA